MKFIEGILGLEGVEQRLVDSQQILSTIETQFAGIQEMLAAILAQVGTIQEQVASHQERIATISDQVGSNQQHLARIQEQVGNEENLLHDGQELAAQVSSYLEGAHCFAIPPAELRGAAQDGSDVNVFFEAGRCIAEMAGKLEVLAHILSIYCASLASSLNRMRG